MSASDFVYLRGGLTVPLPALQVLWSLEDRGVRLMLEGEDGIIARPRTLLTDQDRVDIRHWRSHVIAVLRYCEQERAQ